MPHTIEISTEEHIAYVKGFGEISMASSIDSMERLINHQDFQPQFGVLIDSRDTINKPGIQDMRNIVSLVQAYRHHLKGKIAMVVNEADLKKIGVLCMLLRSLGITMEGYADIRLAKEYLIREQANHHSV